jgi:hypothetical protein
LNTCVVDGYGWAQKLACRDKSCTWDFSTKRTCASTFVSGPKRYLNLISVTVGPAIQTFFMTPQLAR